MQRTMLHGKLHRVRVTATHLEYEGSVAIDRTLLEAADIHEHEQIHIYNLANGERFTSYAVAAEHGSGTIEVLGAAARRACPDDLLIICNYAVLSEDEMADHQPRCVYVDERNRIISTDQRTLPQPARIAV